MQTNFSSMGHSGRSRSGPLRQSGEVPQDSSPVFARRFPHRDRDYSHPGSSRTASTFCTSASTRVVMGISLWFVVSMPIVFPLLFCMSKNSCGLIKPEESIKKEMTFRFSERTLFFNLSLSFPSSQRVISEKRRAETDFFFTSFLKWIFA